MDTNHYLKDFEQWERTVLLELEDGAVWDRNLVETVMKISWQELVARATSLWKPDYLYRVWRLKEV